MSYLSERIYRDDVSESRVIVRGPYDVLCDGEIIEGFEVNYKPGCPPSFIETDFGVYEMRGECEIDYERHGGEAMSNSIKALRDYSLRLSPSIRRKVNMLADEIEREDKVKSNILVRCRDCEFFESDDVADWCTRFDFGMEYMDNGFCAWGERRDV